MYDSAWTNSVKKCLASSCIQCDRFLILKLIRHSARGPLAPLKAALRS